MMTDRYAAIVAAPERSAADRATDVRRKPAQLLAFIGVRPGMKVLDLSAARGYTSELLARAVGPAGTVYAQNAPRLSSRMPPPQAEGRAVPPLASPPGAAPTLAERAQRLPTIVPVQRVFEEPAPPEVADGGLDLVTIMFNYHDLGHMGVDRARMNRAVFRALKHGGHFVIADHAGRPGTGISEAGTLHRVEEDFVKREVEAAGFRLAAEGTFMRNPADPRDRNTPEPPMPKDEFVLKFVKP
jgi:predicted methyltransferase